MTQVPGGFDAPYDTPPSGAGESFGRASRYQRLLDEGRHASTTEMAAAERIERGYLGTSLRLTLLPPALVEELLEAKARLSTTLPELLQPFPEAFWHSTTRLAIRRQIRPQTPDQVMSATFPRGACRTNM